MRKGVWIFILVAFLAAFSFGQAEQQGPAGSLKGAQLPPEQAAKIAPLIMGYDVAPGAGKDIANYPTNSSLGYKGVIMADLDNDGDDEIFVDFGSIGVWLYDNGTWTQESGVNPQGMISVYDAVTPDEEIVVDFGSLGVWYWNYGWTQISGVNPDGMVAVDDDGDGSDEIQVDFGSVGVWRCELLSPFGAWTQLSGLNPYNGLRMDFRSAGWEEGAWTFPGAGVGLWNIWMGGTTPVYNQLTGTTTAEDDFASANFTAATGAKDLVADYSSLGLWLFRASNETWYQISNQSMNRIREVKFVGGSTDYELLAQYNSDAHLYWGNWNGSGFTWTLITSDSISGSSWCEPFDKDGTDGGDEEVVIPLTAGGASLFDYSGSGYISGGFVSAGSNWHINFLVRGDYYGRGHDSTMATVFSSTSDGPGLWIYDQTAGWTHLSSVVPDGIY